MYYKNKKVEILESGLSLTKIQDSNGYEFWVKTGELTSEQFSEPVSQVTFRLNSKMEAVLEFMRDGQWRTLKQISEAACYPSLTGLSAAIRSLRKPEHGSHVVEKRFITESLYEYRLVN